MKRINKKGFTLIELLGVIVILIVMLSLVLPKVINRVKSKEGDIALINDNIMARAASLYVEDNKDEYPEVNGNKYCISLSDLGENYLGTAIKDYRGNSVTGKEIQVEYNNAYSFYVVEEGMCVEVSQDSSRCEGEGLCNVCYVSKTYNNNVNPAVYLFEPKIIGEISEGNSSNIENLVGSVYVESMDDCMLLAIIEAAKQYVADHPRDYKKVNGNVYCLPLSTLVSAGHLKSPVIYQNQNITNTHGIEIHIVNGERQYSLTSKTSCQEYFECGTYMDLPSNLTPVVYDESIRKWVITTEDDGNWFDYGNQKWANAVILTENALSTKKVGDPIEVDGENYDAYAMFVWVPRFSYTVMRTYNSSDSITRYGDNLVPSLSPGGIDIKCVSPTTKHTGAAYYRSDANNAESTLYTHPAFTLGAQTMNDPDDDVELSGIWYGKYNISFEFPTKHFNSVLHYGDVSLTPNVDILRVLPNRYIVSKTISSINTIIDQINETSKFRVDANEAHIHLEKNTDYVALTYFYWSKYGKYGNQNYSASNRVVYGNIAAVDTYPYWGRSAGNTSAPSVYFESKLPYDVSLNSEKYTINGGLSTVAYNVTRSGFDSNWRSDGITDGTLTINFTISQGKVGRVSFNYEYENNGSSWGGISFALYTNNKKLLVPFKDTDRYRSFSSESYSKDLLPGDYTLIFEYESPGKSILNSKCYTGSSPAVDNGKCHVQITNFSVKQTSNYTTSTVGQANGTGASTTGTIYGVYDLGGVVAGKSGSNGTRYVNGYKRDNNLCDGSSTCKGHGLWDLQAYSSYTRVSSTSNYYIIREGVIEWSNSSGSSTNKSEFRVVITKP